MAAREKRRAESSDDGLAAVRHTATGELRPRDVYYSSADNLRLYAADYGDPLSPWLPVVCLPGLTRSSRDFHQLATYLAGHRHRPRRILAFDYRGRGKSEWDKNPAGYNPLTEMADVLAGMAATGVSRAVIVGTSRGGIIGMLMAIDRPGAVAGLVLNDVGPSIEALGLARIRAYVGRTPVPDDWTDAAHIQRRLHGGLFTAWGDEDWDAFARLTYREEEGHPQSDYDPALAGTLDGVELDREMPSLWNEFSALHAIPVLSIRGENSDLLSHATVARMAREHPALSTISVPNEGHPPLLVRSSLLSRISAFITALEGSGPSAEAVIPQESPAFNLDARDD